VVSFKVGGVPDQVQPSITGYLAEPENSKDFCEGIAQLLEDEFLRHQMSQQCRVHALENFNLELCIQRYIDLYQMLVG
jgi:glycosyltransferase involved in cell wall biosynthesis